MRIAFLAIFATCLISTPSIAEDNNIELKPSVETLAHASNQTVVGIGVQGDNTDGAVFIGSGDIYLKLAPDGTVTLHGTNKPDEAVQAVLSGLKVVIGLNPYYCNKAEYPTGYGMTYPDHKQ